MIEDATEELTGGSSTKAESQEPIGDSSAASLFENIFIQYYYCLITCGAKTKSPLFKNKDKFLKERANHLPEVITGKRG